MLGIPLLQRSRVYAECDECSGHFDPGNGGFCPSCSRLLCEEHYHGSSWQRLRRAVSGETKCRACASGTPPV